MPTKISPDLIPLMHEVSPETPCPICGATIECKHGDGNVGCRHAKGRQRRLPPGYTYSGKNSEGLDVYTKQAEQIITDDIIQQFKDPEDPLTDLLKRVEQALKIADPARQYWELKQISLDTKGWSTRDLTELWARQQDSSRKFSPMPLAEFLTKVTPRQEYVIDGLIPKAVNILCFADIGVGKSLLLYHMSLCIALGVPWNGFNVSAGGVLIVQTDEPSKVTGRRLMRMGYEQAIATNCVWIEQHWQFSQMRLFEMWLEQHRPAFVLIDCLTTCNRQSAGDEKDSIYGLVQNDLMFMADKFNCTIVTLHHENTRGTMRGNTAIGAHVCEVWHLRKSRLNEVLQPTERILEISKSRCDCQGHYLLNLNPDNYHWEFKGDPAYPEPGKITTKAAVLHWLQHQFDSGVWYQVDEIVEGTNCNDNSVRRELRVLVNQGLVDSRSGKPDKKGRPCTEYRSLKGVSPLTATPEKKSGGSAIASDQKYSNPVPESDTNFDRSGDFRSSDQKAIKNQNALPEPDPDFRSLSSADTPEKNIEQTEVDSLPVPETLKKGDLVWVLIDDRWRHAAYDQPREKLIICQKVGVPGLHQAQQVKIQRNTFVVTMNEIRRRL